ncbi:hypothetical protein E2C01_036606 [Portunus trituberculatus]|uniref:Uncharacterized protein n=1 Tax=Portunus trituberculatus TaxID=210409 RepID=A0A5B7F744_PORTR|nr:hypothetical protein [Portunus trituberculatus]
MQQQEKSSKLTESDMRTDVEAGSRVQTKMMWKRVDKNDSVIFRVQKAKRGVFSVQLSGVQRRGVLQADERAERRWIILRRGERPSKLT